VFLAGLCTGAPIWNLIIHDWSKFTRNEYPHYQKQFFGDKSDPEGFIKAWIHHQNHNPHHWEYWIPRTGHGRCTPPYKDNEPVKMPDCYVKEMIADWLGAGRAYNKTWPDESHWMWFWENFDRMILHPETRNDVVIRVKKLQDSRLYKYLKKYV
jgi:hypothetical protein